MTNHQHSKKFSLLWVPLLMALVLSGCGKGCGKSGVPTGEASVLKLLPAGKNILVSINWKQLANSPLGGKFKENIPEKFQSFAQEIEKITIASNIQDMGKGPEDGMAVVSGTFNQEKLLELMKAQAQKDGGELQESDYQGVKVYNNSLPEDDMAAAFLDKNLVLGKKMAVQQAIDLTKGKGESIEKNQKLMDLLKGVDTERTLWAVALIPEGVMGEPGARQPGDPLATLSGLKALDLALDVSKGLKMDLGVVASTPEEAKQMETMVNSYKTLFGSSLAQQDPRYGKIIDNLNIKVEGNRVALNLQLEQKFLEDFNLNKGPETLTEQPSSPPETPEEVKQPTDSDAKPE